MREKTKTTIIYGIAGIALLAWVTLMGLTAYEKYLSIQILKNKATLDKPNE